jgi:hypothetical protein
MTSKAEDILLVLNDLDPLDLNQLKFSVITDASSLTAGQGPMAGQIVDLGEPRFWPFEKGEIIVNNGEGGRERFGEGRKPSKWDVADVAFDTLEEALECRRKVLSGEWPRSYE